MMRISSFQMLRHVVQVCRRSVHQSAIYKIGIKGIELRMPALSPTMSQGTIVKWLKNEGDKVSPGDALCEIQTDKAIMTFDIEEEGILAKILIPNDSKDVNIGTLIAMLVAEGEDWKQVDIPNESSSVPLHIQTSAPSGQAQSTSHQTAAQQASSKIVLGPAAKKLLLTFGLDKATIIPSGPRNTLLKGDVLQYVESKNLKPVKVESLPSPSLQKPKPKKDTEKLGIPVATSEQVFIDTEKSEWRKTIGITSLQSKTSIPHSYCAIECKVDNILQLENNLRKDNINITLDDFFIKATGVALQRVPEVNAQWTENTVRLLPNIDVAVTIQTTEGPVSPVIYDVAGTGILGISQQLKELMDKADKALLFNTQSGGCITVANLMGYGVTEFMTVVPQNQSAVLAIGATRLTIDDNGQIQRRITINMSYDRRVFDEEVAAKFLEEFSSVIECPELILTTWGSSQIKPKSLSS